MTLSMEVTAGQPDAPPLTLKEMAERDGVSFVLALFVDLVGKPCAKLVPAAALDTFEVDGVGFAGYAAGALGQQPADPDLIAKPDLASYAPIPFVRAGLAFVHCDLYVEGEIWPFAPRAILKATLARAAGSGFDLFVGAEVEYFLVSRGAGGIAPADSSDTAPRPCYDARDLTRMYEHLTAVSTAMNELGWGNYANDHEDGNGQFEQNFDYADALTTADRVVALRYIISTLAEKSGMIATYMAKPFTDRTGTGMHLHLSLWRENQPLFPAESAVDDAGLGLSRIAHSFIAGVLAHAGALQSVIGPTVNSYKRTGAATSRTGATWSPAVASYGGNDRTHFIRVPDANRIELRGTDGSANPYLAIAATLAAGLDGINRSLPPGPVGALPGSAALPPTLLHAVDALDADPVVQAALDVVGPGVYSYYSGLKRQEFFDWHATVSPWEIERYLTAF